MIKDEQNLKYLNPDTIYIPLINGEDEDITVLVRPNDYIYKEMALAKTKGENRIPIISSISGNFLNITQMEILDGKMIKCLAIKNDFKELSLNNDGLIKNINEYTKDELINTLQKCGIVEIDDSYPVYKKYMDISRIKTVVINALHFTVFPDVSRLLEVIDTLMMVNKIDKAIIIIRRNKELIDKINTFLGTYVNIKVCIVPKIYSLKTSKKILKKYNLKTDETIIHHVLTVGYIYHALKENKGITKKYVTFDGDIERQNYLVKIGTKVSEIINMGNYDVYVNNKKVGPNLIVSPTLNKCTLVKRR